MVNSLSGKNIIIAGSNGYIGNQFAQYLDNNKIKYVEIDKLPSKKKYQYRFNLIDKKKIQDLIKQVTPDYFFHFATHSALAYKNNFLNSFSEDNNALVNIINGLNKSQSSKCKLIYFSSSYVYSGLDIENTVDEKTILAPCHNFGLAKMFFEQMLLREYSNSIIFRLSSVFGEGNYLHPNAIEVMAKEAIKNNTLTVWGHGKRKMQYVFLDDVVKNIIALSGVSSGIFNLCSNNYSTVKDTAEIIANYFNSEIKMLNDKKEGETLPFIENNKIIKVVKDNLFSDFEDSLKAYLSTFSE